MKRWLLAFSTLAFSMSAFADAAKPEAPSLMMNVLMMGAIFFAMYFLFIRPQQKRAKDHQSMISTITKDDEVITAGGLLGRVTKVSDQYLVVAIAEGIEVKVQKQAITASIPKGTIKNI